MTTAQFKTEFERLLAAFPYFKPANPKVILDLWFGWLKKFDSCDFHQAADEVIDEAPEFFPPVGRISKRCAEIETERRRKRIREALDSCQVCSGTGWELIEENSVRRMKKCRCTVGITAKGALHPSSPPKIAPDLEAEQRAARIKEALEKCEVCRGSGVEFTREAGMLRIKECRCIASIIARKNGKRKPC